jgi:hypothetical protein
LLFAAGFFLIHNFHKIPDLKRKIYESFPLVYDDETTTEQETEVTITYETRQNQRQFET